MDALYSTEALATGAGRNGHAATADGSLEFSMAIPKEMGGSGDGANPEQLFALGYAACFHSALQAVARAEKKDLGDSSVGARVSIGKQGAGFGLAVDLEVVIPAMEALRAEVDALEAICADSWWPVPSYNAILYYEDHSPEKGNPIVLVPGFCCSTHLTADSNSSLSSKNIQNA